MFDFNVIVSDKFTIVELPATEMNFTNAKLLKKKLKELIEQGHLNIILNLAKVNYLDSTCLGVIVSMHKYCIASGGELRICSLSEDVEMIFYLTGVDSVLNIFLTLNEALNYQVRQIASYRAG